MDHFNFIHNNFKCVAFFHNTSYFDNIVLVMSIIVNIIIMRVFAKYNNITMLCLINVSVSADQTVLQCDH